MNNRIQTALSYNLSKQTVERFPVGRCIYTAQSAGVKPSLLWRSIVDASGLEYTLCWSLSVTVQWPKHFSENYAYGFTSIKHNYRYSLTFTGKWVWYSSDYQVSMNWFERGWKK